MIQNLWSVPKSVLERIGIFYLVRLVGFMAGLAAATWLSWGLQYFDLFCALCIPLLLFFALKDAWSCWRNWVKPPGIPASGWTLDKSLLAKVTSGSPIERWDALCGLLWEDLSKKLKNAQVPAELSWREEQLFNHVALELRGALEAFSPGASDEDLIVLLHLLALRPWRDGQALHFIRQRKLWDALRHMLLLSLEQDLIEGRKEEDPILVLLRCQNPPTGEVMCAQAHEMLLSRVASRLLNETPSVTDDEPGPCYSIRGTAWQTVESIQPRGIHFGLDRIWAFWHRFALYGLTPRLVLSQLPETKWNHRLWWEMGCWLSPWLLVLLLLALPVFGPYGGYWQVQEVRPQAFVCGVEVSLTPSSQFGFRVGKLSPDNGNNLVPLVLVNGRSLGYDCFWPPWQHRIDHSDARLLPVVSDLKKVQERWPAAAPSLAEWLEDQLSSAGAVVAPAALELQFLGLRTASSEDAATQDYLTAVRLATEEMPGDIDGCGGESSKKSPFWICTLPPLQRDAIRRLLELYPEGTAQKRLSLSFHTELHALRREIDSPDRKGQYAALAALLDASTQAPAVMDLDVLKQLYSADSLHAWPDTQFCTSRLQPNTMGSLGHRLRCIEAWANALLRVPPSKQRVTATAVDAKAWVQLVSQLFAAVKSWRRTSYDTYQNLSLDNAQSKVLLNAELGQTFTPFTLRGHARGLANVRVHLIGMTGADAVADLRALEDILLAFYLPADGLGSLSPAELHLRRELAVLMLGQAMFEWMQHPDEAQRLIPSFKEGHVLYQHTPRGRTLRIEATGLAVSMQTWLARHDPKKLHSIPQTLAWWKDFQDAHHTGDPFYDRIVRRAITEPHVILSRYGVSAFR